MITIKNGLSLPIAGAPEQVVHTAPPVKRVGVMLADYPDIEPQWLVGDGERVRTGQALFCDREFPQIKITAPATGVAQFLNGADSVAPSAITIAVEADEFVEFPVGDIETLTRPQVCATLLAAGLWPAFRTRPLQRVPIPEAVPQAIFVTAMDTQPLAPRAELLIEAELAAFTAGLTAISCLTDGLVYVCKAPAAYVPVPDIANIKVEEFAGPHPAGLAGTHIHFLDPVNIPGKTVWSIGYQDVIAIGDLLTSGHFPAERIVALAGPQVVDARLLRVRQGVDIGALCAGELKAESGVLISGSVFCGRLAVAEHIFLGRYHSQVTALRIAQKGAKNKRWWGWGIRQFSVLPLFLSRLLRVKRFHLAANGSPAPQPWLPLASFKRIWPLRLWQMPLLRALLDNDVERALALGALELVEEDLALTTFVCPGKRDYGPMLRAVLNTVDVRPAGGDRDV